jgi:hypothetical protein
VKIPKIHSHPFFKGGKKCKNLGVGKDLTEFAKIFISESLKKFTEFNGKS